MDGTIGSRIAELRKHMKLTQEDLAEKIGCARAAIANYERGNRIPLDSVITAICREFNVSESWLREGTGAMLIPVTADQMLAQAFGKLVSGRDEAAEDRKVFMKMLMSLTPEQLAAVKAVILEMAKDFTDE